MPYTLRATAQFVFAIGLLAALAAAFVYGVEDQGYSTELHPVPGFMAGAVAFVPTLFMWAVLKGLAELVERGGGPGAGRPVGPTATAGGE
jgi:hypothetical protein